MKNKIMRSFTSALMAIVTSSYLFSSFPASVSAVGETKPVVVVSLGDSYSSGEGIEPFYYQNEELSKKITKEDWLAHRSEKSWPSQLVIPGVDGTMSDYDVIKNKGNEECKWYFKAVSGAETKHFDSVEQGKTVFKYTEKHLFKDDEYLESSPKLPTQLSVFDTIPTGTVDYVTMSVGGNDVHFVDIVTTCATKSTHIHFINDDNKVIKKQIKETLENLYGNNGTLSKIKNVYKKVADKAGSQATIIVAGYPKLFDKTGKGALISEEEATIVNDAVKVFNSEIETVVSDCRKEGYNIYFVDVVDKFDGHEAYTHSKKAGEDKCWINHIMLGTEDNDLDDREFVSAYSMHPNEYGAKAYAKRVNEEIAKLGMLSGKVVKASDRTSPIKEAKVTIYQNNIEYATTTTDATGNYQMRLPEGDYRVEITANGYIDFKAYATITRQEVKYMETFLMVEGSEDEIGNASGKVFDGLTGNGINDVTLTIRKGWNTPENDENDVIKTIKTNSNGSYSVELPYGNYTVYAAKDGYISTTFNIISQKGTTSEQNGTMSSAVLGDGYRIILTWDEYPEDLDSHVVGKLSDGGLFHVYYEHMSQYDGKTEVCNLDVDDITSYGPETITLTPTTTSAYYYYIYRYSGSQGTVGSSGAQIKLYKGETLINTFNVPTNLGESDYWNVFAIKNGEPIIKNTITSSADTSYAE